MIFSFSLSPEIYDYHTVWRTWHLIACSDESWLNYQISLHHSYICSWMVRRICILSLGVKGLTHLHICLISWYLWLVFVVVVFCYCCVCFAVSLRSPPWFLAPSLTHHMYQNYGPLPSLLQCVFPSTTTHEYPVLFHLHHPFPCSTATFPTHSHRHTHHHTSFLSPLPHQPPIPYINCTGIPIPVINNEH